MNLRGVNKEKKYLLYYIHIIIYNNITRDMFLFGAYYTYIKTTIKRNNVIICI